MKNVSRRLIFLFLLYCFWIIAFMIQKPLFMLFNPVEGAGISDFINVIIHGTKLDFCFAAYFLFIPVLMFIVECFINYNIKKWIYIYTSILYIIITIVFSVDTVLYSYWGFRIDASLLFYLKDFKESLNSVTFADVLKFIVVSVFYLSLIYLLYYFTLRKFELQKLPKTNKSNFFRKILLSLLFIILLPILVICSRGGISTATANVSMVYYCDNQKLNLSAVNPAFNLLYSLSKNEDFANKYKFYDDEFCDSIVLNDLLEYKYDDSEVSFLLNQKPNIIVILLESFSGRFIQASNGNTYIYENKTVTPNLNDIAEKSITFTNAYSNGMRTDRGIVSVLSGFPAQPDMTIIKYPEKTSTLPSMAKTLASQEYNTEMIYGGDINFANMRSYFYGTGYKNIIDCKSFPSKDRKSKWGVNDAVMFDYLFKRINNYDKSQPFFTTFLSLSSHEPFDVDFSKFDDKYINSLAYTDSCLGVFLNRMEKSELWNNTLIILVADHASPAPEALARQNPELYHIPILFTGGVIQQPAVIDKLINQTDIAKTVFRAMGVPADEFIYSRDIFNSTYKNWAVYCYTSGFGFIDDTGLTVWDKDAGKVIQGGDSIRETYGKSFLQFLYKDIANR